MNNTKWNEIFQAFYYNNECNENSVLIRWRTKDRNTGYLSAWDGTWTHFGCEPHDWKSLDYLQIELTGENRAYVIEQLKAIHVPGIQDRKSVTIYAYRQDIDYI